MQRTEAQSLRSEPSILSLAQEGGFAYDQDSSISRKQHAVLQGILVPLAALTVCFTEFPVSPFFDSSTYIERNAYTFFSGLIHPDLLLKKTLHITYPCY